MCQNAIDQSSPNCNSCKSECNLLLLSKISGFYYIYYARLFSKTIVKIPKTFFIDLLSIRSDVSQSLRSNVSLPDCSIEVSAVPDETAFQD